MDSTEQFSANNTASQEARDKLMGDLKVVIRDAEELLRNTGQQTGDGFKAAKAKFENTLINAKHQLHSLEDAVVWRTKEAARATDQYVSDHPWQSVGLAAAVGLIAGMLIARR